VSSKESKSAADPMTMAALRACMTRWLAEPHQLIITIVILVALLTFGAVGAHQMFATPKLSPDELARARSGVIVMKSPDPTFCKQLRFDNSNGSFKPATTECQGEGPLPSRDTQIDVIRRGFRRE